MPVLCTHMPSEEDGSGHPAEPMLSVPELHKGNRRGCTGQQGSGEDEQGSFESLLFLPHPTGGQRSNSATPGTLLQHLQSRTAWGQKGTWEDCRKSSRRIRHTEQQTLPRAKQPPPAPSCVGAPLWPGTPQVSAVPSCVGRWEPQLLGRVRPPARLPSFESLTVPAPGKQTGGPSASRGAVSG